MKKQGFSGSNDPRLGMYGPIITGIHLKEAVSFPARRVSLSASISILLATRLGLKSINSP